MAVQIFGDQDFVGIKVVKVGVNSIFIFSQSFIIGYVHLFSFIILFHGISS